MISSSIGAHCHQMVASGVSSIVVLSDGQMRQTKTLAANQLNSGFKPNQLELNL